MDTENKDLILTWRSLLVVVTVTLVLERSFLRLGLNPSVAQGLALGYGLGVQSFFSDSSPRLSLSRRLLAWLVIYPALTVSVSYAIDLVSL